jgi:hypothetical protein
MYGDLKLTFMHKCLRDYNEEVMRLMALTMDRKNVGITDEGKRSLAYQALQEGSGAHSTLSFKEYLRFVDMGVGRGHPLGGLKSMSIALKASNKKGKAFVKDNTIKPRKIYAKVAYGKLNYLYNKLLYGFTEETIAIMKQEIQSPTN